MRKFVIIEYWALMYIILMLLFCFIANKFYPSFGIILFQIFFVCSITLLSSIFLKRSVSHNVILFVLTVFQLFATIWARIFNKIQYHNYLGFEPADAQFYHDIGTRFSDSSFSVYDMFIFFESNSIAVDDWGFCSIISFIYSLFGINIGMQLLALCNVLFIIVGAHFLYKLSRYFADDYCANSICFLWGIMPFSVYTSSVGLKENYMVFCVIISVYYLYEFMRRSTFRNLLLFGGFAASLLFFRTAIFFMLIATFLFVYMIRFSLIAKNINLWLSFLFVLSYLIFGVIVDFIGGLRGNVSMETIQMGINAKISENGGIIAKMTNFLAILIGPFPCFVADRMKVNYITLYSFGTMMKMMLSGFYIYGVIRIIKEKDLFFYPLLIFIFLHSIMLIMTFFTLHDRYQWVQIPFVLLISLYGYNKLNNERRILQQVIFGIYPLLMLLFIIIYNMRIS